MHTGLHDRGTITRRTLLRTAAVGAGAALLDKRLGLGLSLASASTPLVAETHYGKVRGVDVHGVALFAGIPYGDSTAGAGRFMPPSRTKPWAGIREADMPGPRAMQTEAPLGPLGKDPLSQGIDLYFTGGGPNSFELANNKVGEDCLVLNVCTPGLRGKRPVMVYLHGGGFASGDGILALSAD